MRARAYMSQIGVEGALLVLAPTPLLFISREHSFLNSIQSVILSSFIVLLIFLLALSLFRKPFMAKCCGVVAAIGLYVSLIPHFQDNPFLALFINVLFLGSLYLLFEFRIKLQRNYKTDHKIRSGQRALWGAFTLPLGILIEALVPEATKLALYVVGASSIITVTLYLQWAWVHALNMRVALTAMALLLLIHSILILSLEQLQIIALLMSFAFITSLPRQSHLAMKKERWWDIFFSHPERILITTFFSMCVVGTALLVLPLSTTHGSISIIDAVFTAVSAVCVTGLITLDTPNDFTRLGQFFILVLIQLGGLGIMSITTVALHAMGRRLSLKQERLLTTLTDTSHNNLIHSLKLILKYTLIIELLGATLLCLCFLWRGDSFGMAAWRGLFTSISAFCNAGFALQSESLIPYQEHSLVLHTIAVLIILGGMAPAMSLFIPNWILGRPTPITVRIALTTTSTLLLLGTLFFLLFEWNGAMADLGMASKFHNAWFQSVTLRTAGFNSIDITDISSPTFLTAIFLMFIGGSPGGTAGGVKTTTIGVLALVFWANLTGKGNIVAYNRLVPNATIFRAITIVISGLIVWLLVVLMLLVTQEIPSHDLVFEATSALATVGLSTGATLHLDEIGKVIVIFTMFVGRVGPVTLFMLLNTEQKIAKSKYPEERITLT